MRILIFQSRGCENHIVLAQIIILHSSKSSFCRKSLTHSLLFFFLFFLKWRPSQLWSSTSSSTKLCVTVNYETSIIFRLMNSSWWGVCVLVWLPSGENVMKRRHGLLNNTCGLWPFIYISDYWATRFLRWLAEIHTFAFNPSELIEIGCFKKTQLSTLINVDIINQTLLSNTTAYRHSYIDGDGCHARFRPAHQEQFGVQYLAQGHFDMQTRRFKPATFRCQDAGSTPEPQPPSAHNEQRYCTKHSLQQHT